MLTFSPASATRATASLVPSKNLKSLGYRRDFYFFVKTVYNINMSLSTIKDDKADDFSADAREASRSSFETENQLSSSLITVTLAFIALIATAISTSNVLYVIVDFQKWIILAAMIIFSISILAGLINYFKNMNFHRQTSAINERLADRAEGAHSAAELASIRRASNSKKPRLRRRESRNRFLIISQILSVIIGLALTVAFVGTLLFYTSTREDYTDELPIYDDIMEQKSLQNTTNN